MNDPHDEVRYPFRTVARRTGRSPRVPRAWEKRYSVVEPAPPNGGMRLNSDADVVRIRLLKRLAAMGHGIGRVARLSVPEVAVRPSADAARGLREALQSPETMGGSKLHTSVVLVESLESLANELHGMRNSEGDGVEITIGGQGARNARAAIRRAGARWISDYDAVRPIVRQLNPSRSGE